MFFKSNLSTDLTKDFCIFNKFERFWICRNISIHPDNIFCCCCQVSCAQTPKALTDTHENQNNKPNKTWYVVFISISRAARTIMHPFIHLLATTITTTTTTHSMRATTTQDYNNHSIPYTYNEKNWKKEIERNWT